MARTGLVYDPVYLEHHTGEHVEKAQRLLSIIEILRSTKPFGAILARLRKQILIKTGECR